MQEIAAGNKKKNRYKLEWFDEVATSARKRYFTEVCLLEASV